MPPFTSVLVEMVLVITIGLLTRLLDIGELTPSLTVDLFGVYFRLAFTRQTNLRSAMIRLGSPGTNRWLPFLEQLLQRFPLALDRVFMRGDTHCSRLRPMKITTVGFGFS